MILSRYVARRFLRMFLLIAGVFLAILFLIDMVEEIRRFGGRGVGLGGAARLAALTIAGSFYEILPLVTLLSGVALFLALARSSELVAIRASGRSALRALAAPAVTAFLLGVIAVAVLNPFVAATIRHRDAVVTAISQGGTQTVSVGDEAVWLRQSLAQPVTVPAGGSSTASAAAAATAAAQTAAQATSGETGQVVIRAGRASTDATTLYDASFTIFSPGVGPTRRIEAAEARLTPNAWQLTDTKEWRLDAANPEATATTRGELSLPTDLTAERIRDGFGQPDSVQIWQLPAFIRGLESAGFSAQRHRVWFQMELARPLLMAAMVVIAAAFTMRHSRGRRTGLLVLGALAAGVALFFLRNLAQVLGNNAQVPALLAAWAPPLAALLFALGAILTLEDG
ncbi:LPS export ABC transporter permease LptG [Paracoccus pacificus]|uniref:LPS export ABC transporter permease LptG n=1 Tax=Paracoccus pacificus TaxID=1463598 RepID=A0ABW4R8Z8_9RHOB